MSKSIIIANWKSNPASEKEAVALAKKIEDGILDFRNTEVVIAAPFLFISSLRQSLKKIKLGAQNTFWEDVGPYTGEVSWRQLKNIGVRYIIIGHSERKIYMNENDEMINKKVKAVTENGMIPILCIGERERTGNDIPAVVGDQLKNALAGIKKNFIKNIIIAYEPIWAISTQEGSRPDTADSAFRALVYIKKIISDLYGRSIGDGTRIIYGGSVNSKNINSFLKEGKMMGALVGGASLDAGEFTQLVKSINLL